MSQAEQLQQTMSFFKLDGSSSRRMAHQVRKSSASTKAAPKSAANRTAPSHASASSDDLDESQFTKF